MRSQPISTRAFAMLLLACMFAGNHVAARVALDHGVEVATAVAVRSLVTAAVVAMIVLLYRAPLALQARHRKMLALDVSGAASGLRLQDHWLGIGSGVGFALVASASFGLVLALTRHEAADLDGRLRTTITMGIVGVLALLGVVGSSPILNVEPVAALAMAWLWLGQSVSLVQLLGALLVVETVMVLGLRRR